jgi:heme/copper-type cytochrome/quinol oxidase subunit 2
MILGALIVPSRRKIVYKSAEEREQADRMGTIVTVVFMFLIIVVVLIYVLITGDSDGAKKWLTK